MHCKLLLIDGNSLLYRAFFALPHLSTSSGQPTNGVYGFTMMLLKVIEEERPDLIGVCFDLPKPTFRHRRFAEYKAQRQAAPDELRSQIGLAREVLEAMEIPLFDLEGYEADDLIGAIVSRAEARGCSCLVVTGDLDTLQLVSPQTAVLTTRRGITDTVLYDQAAVRERFGVEPEQLPDLKSLRGDPSDNIPGVPGIGEKSARRLIQQYGSLERLLEHREELPGQLRAGLTTWKEQAELSKQLLLLDREAPIEVDFSLMQAHPLDLGRVLPLFRRLEFKSLLRKLEGTPEQQTPDWELVSTPEQLRQLIGRVEAEGQATFYLATTSGPAVDARPLGVAFAFREGPSAFVPLSPPGNREEGSLFSTQCWQPADPRALRAVWEPAELPKTGHHLKNAWLALHRAGVAMDGLAFDAMVASYLLNPSRQSHRLEDIVFDQLQIPPGEPFVPAAAWLSGEVDQVAAFCCREADYLRRVTPVLQADLDELGVADLFRRVEMPLVRVLAKLELAGVAIDSDYLGVLSQKLAGEIAALERKIWSSAGEEFNIGSSRQLQVVLFEKLKLPKGKRTKTGYSTGADVLANLIGAHEIVEKIVRWREMTKLKSTYVDALPRLVNPGTGRVHTTFNQTVTATGRLSSSDPNLQNIPIRSELGKEIRRAFIAPPGCLLLAADYSQIELRVLAHISGDDHLAQIFLDRDDLHTHAAAEIFQVSAREVTSEMRRLAKVVNFAIPYGVSAQGLAQSMGVSAREAEEYMELYFRRFPAVREYMSQIVEQARRTGCVTTLLGRWRGIPDIRSRVRSLREFSERTAINTPIQGSAADIMKLAMLKVDRKLEESGLNARLILQVHDELVVELPESELVPAARILREGMTTAYQLSIPLEVEVSAGRNWAEMERVDEG